MKEATRALLRALGVEQLYPPQEAALQAGVEHGRSVIVATPTASGKTLIGLIAIVNALKDHPGGLAVYTAPLRSIAYEKKDLFDRLGELGFTARLEVGDLAQGPRDADILVTTYEKLDSIFRNNPSLPERVRVAVVDELHYLSDAGRGPVLETLATRLLSLRDPPQIVALSATMPNIGELAGWLDAAPIAMDWRPVPLRESIYKDGVLHYNDGGVEEVGVVAPHAYLNPLSYFAGMGHQAIVFSQSRRKTVILAERTAASLHDTLSYDGKAAREIAREVMATEGPRQLREQLAGLIVKGVAFHHAGLSNAQRRLVEKGFRSGAIAVIHATPTLAAGVNLPARAVIVEEYYRFEEGVNRPIGVYEYKQLAGRAGRPGYDDMGDAVIVASRSDTVGELVAHYIQGDLERIESRLSDLRSLRHAVLGVTDSGVASTREEILGFLSKSFYGYTKGVSGIKGAVSRSIDNLLEWGLLERLGDGRLAATPLGHIVSTRYLDPANIPNVERIIGVAPKPSDTMLLYMVASSPDMAKLPVSRREEDYIMDRALEEDPELIDVVEWFGPEELGGLKVLFLLEDWINEVKEDEIAERFNVGPGDVYTIVETGEWLASSLAEALPLLGVGSEASQRLKVLASRIRHGVREELLLLVVIPGIGRVRARRLYDAGYRSLLDLARADPEKLSRIPGIGPATIRSIMEYFGRRGEAEKYAGPGEAGSEGSGLESFM